MSVAAMYAIKITVHRSHSSDQLIRIYNDYVMTLRPVEGHVGSRMRKHTRAPNIWLLICWWDAPSFMNSHFSSDSMQNLITSLTQVGTALTFLCCPKTASGG